MSENQNLKRAVEMHREFAALGSSIFLQFHLIDTIWEKCREYIYWNEDNSKEDLDNVCGKTYSIETWSEALYEDDDYFLVEGDNGCGDSQYYLFLKERELSS